MESADRQFKAFGLKTRVPLISEPPEFPDIIDYLWGWFGELSLGVASSGMAPAQVTWNDVATWAHLTGIELEPWEARTLVLLGATRTGIQAEKMQASTKDSAEQSSSSRRKR